MRCSLTSTSKNIVNMGGSSQHVGFLLKHEQNDDMHLFPGPTNLPRTARSWSL